MSGRLNFEYGFNNNTAQSLDGDTPMRVYFLGDFTGAKVVTENACINQIIKIDIDNFDDIMVKLSPSVSLPSGHYLTFNELEDFHPDNIFEHAIFKNLRRLKRELNNPATAESAAQEIMANYQLNSESTPQVGKEYSGIEQADKGAEEKTEDQDDMFERLLGQKQSTPSSTAANTSPALDSSVVRNLDRFLGDLLIPYIVKDTKPEYKHLMVYIDTAIEELMNAILHANEFQALESAWRSLRDVIFNEEYDEEKQFFYLVNTDRSALENAQAGESGLLLTLSQHIKDCDVQPYDVIVGNYQFSSSDEDISTLNYLASIAEMLKCQLVSGADSSLINTNINSLWQPFRQTPQASHVALSYPQVLLRIPYGKKHDVIDAFAFEEFRQAHQHSKLLWGNSAFACARLLIRQYHQKVTYDTTITELPAFVYNENDEAKLQPCAELLLSEQQLIDIRNQGIMVFASFRNKNCIRLFGDGIHAINAK